LDGRALNVNEERAKTGKLIPARRRWRRQSDFLRVGGGVRRTAPAWAAAWLVRPVFEPGGGVGSGGGRR